MPATDHRTRHVINTEIAAARAAFLAADEAEDWQTSRTGSDLHPVRPRRVPSGGCRGLRHVGVHGQAPAVIVAITGDRVSVSVDDECADYHPVRTAELVRHCIGLYREACVEVDDAVVEE